MKKLQKPKQCKFLEKLQVIRGSVILSILFLFDVYNINAQCTGAVENSNSPNNSASVVSCSYVFNGAPNYSLQSTFTPTNTLDPVITVKLVVHVFMKTTPDQTDWTSGANQYNGLAALQNLFSGLQGNKERYSSPRVATYSITGFNIINIPDSKIQFEVVKYYFVTDNSIFAGTGQSAIAYLQNNYPDRLSEGIPVIMLDSPGQACGNFSIPSPHYGYTWGNLPYIFVSQAPGTDAATTITNNKAAVRQLNHELGHALGLLHPYYGGEWIKNTPTGTIAVCGYSPVTGTIGSPSPETWNGSILDNTNPNYLSDLFPSNNPYAGTSSSPGPMAYPNPLNCPNPPLNGVSSVYENQESSSGIQVGTNNIMSDNPGNTSDTWISPLQMGRRIRAMHLNSNYFGSGMSSHGNVKKYAKEMVSSHVSTWDITSNETWDFQIQMYKDIVVKSGKILTIRCAVDMATDGKIIVEKGAKLIIDGGRITSWCKKTPSGSSTNYPLWSGIEVDGDPTQNQVINSTTGLCPNQGIVEVKADSEISYAQKGIITSRTSTNGVIQNNTSGGIVIANGAKFINNIFDIILYKYPMVSNACKVTNCLFKTSGLIGSYSSANTQIVPREHIKLFQNRGLAVKGCTFECVPGTYNPANHGSGIYSTDSDFSVDQLGGHSVFKNLKAGVWIDNFSPINSALITNSDFTNNEKGIISENCDYLVVNSNAISVSQGYVGVYTFKSKNFKIKNNNVLGENRNGSVGALSYGSGNGSQEIYRNSFSTLGAGIIAMDDNGGNGTNVTGLKMNCNDFNPSANNTTDIAMTKFILTPFVDARQSAISSFNSGNLVRNIYGAPYFNNNSKNKWYIDPTNSQIIYHATNSQAYTQPNNPNPQSSSQVTVIPTSIPLSYSSDCLASPNSAGGDNPNRIQKLAVMNNYITELKANNPDNRNRFEIQSTVASKLQLFLSDTLNSSMDSVVTILTNNQGAMENADIQLIFAHIKKQDYANALINANALASNRSDWKDLLKKIIEIEQDSLGYNRVATNSSDISFLTNYANTEGKDGQTTAQAILKFALGTQHEFPLVYPEYPVSGSRTRNLNNETETPIVSNDNIFVFPNPAQTSLTIRYTGKYEGNLRVEIKDLHGRLIYTNFISEQNEKLISLTGFSNGVYLVSVYESGNTLIYQNKMIKQE